VKMPRKKKKERTRKGKAGSENPFAQKVHWQDHSTLRRTEATGFLTTSKKKREGTGQ